MKKIETIIFDFGNVLIDLDFSATHKALEQLLGNFYNYDEKENKYPQLIESYEVGRISETQFFEKLKSLSNPGATIKQLKDAWNAMLLNIPTERIKMLDRLRNNYKVYLLSNTNFTHIDFVYQYLLRTHGIVNWESHFFDKIFYSYRIKMRKPNEDIYNFVIENSPINLESMIFFDDNPANIVTAQNLGWNAYLHNPNDNIVEIINEVTNS